MRTFVISISRLVAITVLLSIGVDIVGDANCTTVVAASAHKELSAGSPLGDECRTVCVPDCFCCSPAVGDRAISLVETIGRLMTLEPLAPSPRRDGVYLSVFRPPLLRA